MTTLACVRWRDRDPSKPAVKLNCVGCGLVLAVSLNGAARVTRGECKPACNACTARKAQTVSEPIRYAVLPEAVASIGAEAADEMTARFQSLIESAPRPRGPRRRRPLPDGHERR